MIREIGIVLGLWLLVARLQAHADGSKPISIPDLLGWFLIGFAVRSLLKE